MVSLRGSKFGSRVAMLCCNPSHATRPGPGAGIQIGRYNNFNDDRYQMAGQPGGRFPGEANGTLLTHHSAKRKVKSRHKSLCFD